MRPDTVLLSSNTQKLENSKASSSFVPSLSSPRHKTNSPVGPQRATKYATYNPRSYVTTNSPERSTLDDLEDLANSFSELSSSSIFTLKAPSESDMNSRKPVTVTRQLSKRPSRLDNEKENAIVSADPSVQLDFYLNSLETKQFRGYDHHFLSSLK